MAPCCSQEFCMCSDGDLAKVHHKCCSCQQKVHGPLCGHADEAAFGGPVIICFKCQDPSEHILNSVSEGNQDNDVAFLKSVVASKKNTENYNNARLPGAGAGKKCNCEVFLDLRNDEYELQCIFVMAVGMKQADDLTVFDQEPYTSVKNMKTKYKPSSVLLYEEIV